MTPFVRFSLRSAVAFALSFMASQAAEFTLKTVEKTAPAEFGATIRAVLQPAAIQLLDGDKPAFELWLRAELPLKSRPASTSDSPASIAETTLVGALVVGVDGLNDYKANPIPKGAYTARFALQPQDGDHLGTADYSCFLVLIAAGDDPDLGAMSKLAPMLKASGKLTPSGHPLVLSLRPVAPADAASPSLTEPVADHKALRVKLPGRVGDGGDKTDLAFDLVYKGTGHIQ